ncbi:flagellar hook capping FlgD N-terminal domain-containing protein [Croceibacterium ferulae]|uniref:flagellar hook capping FlgD N-terminal domain-containing protein n=1 Tax=Croceibacterium ferulae TaxID=1854641 RepID=UPI000EB5415A|nr:flagellar hook capping FlgD N-terminal domain-containing protein [Croceibacterium ferulae]
MSLSTITQLQNATASNRTESATSGRGLESLGQADFLQLMTTQLQQQDPFAPVDNTQMLAQMAQFSSLATMTDVSSTLEAISAKLDRLSTANPVTE